MNKNSSKTKENILSLNSIIYVIKYLRCVAVAAQIEKMAVSVYIFGNTTDKNKLIKLNNKHSQLAKNLYQQKLRLELIA